MFTKTGTKKNNYYNVICQNCGDKGHHIKDCINPVTSLGIILYRFIGPTIQYLAVCRKNTIGFVEFIRGKYAINDTAYIQQLFNVMTEHEITLITDKEFEFLWEFLWMDKQFNKVSSKVKRDYDSAYMKFIKINTCGKIEKFIKNKRKKYIEQEWGFPKGRRNYNESNYKAALREFCEETNIPLSDIKLGPETDVFHEKYTSYDNINYSNIYYVAEYIGSGNLSIDSSKPEQYTEVSRIGFFNYENTLSKFRDYDTAKKNMLSKINTFILKI